ncbi:MAG: right-handed parallel beta-helix repeat-containing protein, partial [Planctomycetota bacterium]
MNRILSALSAAVLGTASAAQGGSVLYVDDDAPFGGDGTSWATALRDLQAALDAASEPGSGISEIRVAQGVYFPSSCTDPADPRSATFSLLDGIALRGGYAGFGAPDPDTRDIVLFETILSGSTGAADSPTGCCVVHDQPGCDDVGCALAVCEIVPSCCDPFGSWHADCVLAAAGFCGCEPQAIDSYHVVTAPGLGPTAILEGFVVTGGNAVAVEDGVEPSGAGLYIVGGSPTVASCTFRGNEADGRGGGLIALAASPIVMDCTFTDNNASEGVGMATEGGSPLVIGCVFLETALHGCGALWNSNANPVVRDCLFLGNRGTALHNEASPSVVSGCVFSENSFDGAIALFDGSDAEVSGCVFVGNENSRGPALHAYQSVATVNDCRFEGNSAYDNGGAVYIDAESALFERCDFVANQAVGNFPGSDGGAIYFVSGISIDLIDCSFVANSAGHSIGYDSRGGALYVLGLSTACTVTGCRFVGNLSVERGGAVYAFAEAEVADCEFLDNESLAGAGGLYAAASLVLERCRFSGNRAPWGGGLAVTDESLITRCVFEENQAAYGGGGMSVFLNGRATVINSLFIANSASDEPTAANGGALACWPQDARATVINSTFVANYAEGFGGGIYVGRWRDPDKWLGNAHLEVANCILWANSDAVGGEGAQIYVDRRSKGYSAALNYSVVQGLTGNLGGMGNIGDNPEFIDLKAGDFRLSSGSPCIDAGDNTAISVRGL